MTRDSQYLEKPSSLRLAGWQSVLQTGRAMLTTLRRAFTPSFKSRPPLSFRGQPVLRRDDYGNILCTACGACVDACPTDCICIVQDEGVIEFQIDWRRCMYCARCASVCPVRAIELSCEANIYVSATTQNEDQTL
jgi:hydrogenase-4 component H